MSLMHNKEEERDGGGRGKGALKNDRLKNETPLTWVCVCVCVCPKVILPRLQPPPLLQSMWICWCRSTALMKECGARKAGVWINCSCHIEGKNTTSSCCQHHADVTVVSAWEIKKRQEIFRKKQCWAVIVFVQICRCFSVLLTAVSKHDVYLL